MSRATPQMRDLSQRLVALEARGTKTDGTHPPVFPICEKLRPPLAMLMGRAGFHALLSRALTISREEVDWLRTVMVTEEGALGISDEGGRKANAKEQAEGSMVLVAQVLGLLVAFIGEILTLQLVREIWPKLPPNEPEDKK